MINSIQIRLYPRLSVHSGGKKKTKTKAEIKDGKQAAASLVPRLRGEPD